MPHPAPAHKSFSDKTSLYQEITHEIIADEAHAARFALAVRA
jgi:hypothetical protein